MAGGRGGHGVAALSGEVWAVWGLRSGGRIGATVEVYSPRLNTWRAGVPLPSSWYCGACAVVLC